MEALLRERTAIARQPVEPVRTGVARTDAGHAAFRGCPDWHSAVHGV